MTRGQEIVERARSLIGTPYKDLGRDTHGIDCLGLMFFALSLDERVYPEVAAARQLAGGYYNVKNWSSIRRDPAALQSAQILRVALTKYLLEVSLRTVKAGDVLLMAFKLPDKKGDHIGIFSGKGRMIHADMRHGVVEVSIDPRLVRHIVAAYRFEG